MAFITLLLQARFLRLLYVASLLIIPVLTLYGGILCAQGTEHNPPALIDVGVDHGTLTVNVRNAPLAQVLRAIGERAGIQVIVRGNVNSPVTQSFAGVPLEEGLRRLAWGYSLVVAHTAAAGTPRAVMLTRVWVLGSVSTPNSFAAATSAPEITIGRLRHVPERASGFSLLPRQGEQAVARDTEVTVASQRSDWGQEIQTLTEAADRGSEVAVARLGDIIASEADATARHHAVAALGRLTGVEVEPMLTDALGDVDAAVRMRAVRGLRGAGTDTAAQALTAVLAGDPDPQVRLAAVRALVSLPSRTMLQGLEQAAADPDAAVRASAARGLAWWQMHRRDLP